MQTLNFLSEIITGKDSGDGGHGPALSIDSAPTTSSTRERKM